MPVEAELIDISHAKPRTKFAYEDLGDGSLKLTKLVTATAQPRQSRLERRNGRTVVVSDRPITSEDVRRALEDFP